MVCFLEPKGQSVKVVESACDYMSRGFLKLTGPLSVLLVAWQILLLPVQGAGGPMRVRLPSSGRGHLGGGQGGGRSVVAQMLPSQVLHWVCKCLLCQEPRECVHVCRCGDLKCIQILVTVDFLAFFNPCLFGEWAAKESINVRA